MSDKPAPYAKYLHDIDILWIQLRDAPVASSGDIDWWRNVDYAEDGSVVSLEIVNAATVGVNLTGIPERDLVEQLIREAGIELPIPVPAR